MCIYRKTIARACTVALLFAMVSHVFLGTLTPAKLAAGEAAPNEEGIPLPSETSAQASAVKQKLRQPISVDFQETPLTDVIEFFRDATGINFILLQTPLLPVSLEPDTPVTAILKDIPLASVLDQIAKSIEHDWFNAGETIYFGEKPEIDHVQSKLAEDRKEWQKLSPKLRERLSRRVNFDFRDMPLDEFAQILATATSVKMTIGPALAAQLDRMPLVDVALQESYPLDALQCVCQEIPCRWRVVDGETIVLEPCPQQPDKAEK